MPNFQTIINILLVPATNTENLVYDNDSRQLQMHLKPQLVIFVCLTELDCFEGKKLFRQYCVGQLPSKYSDV